MLEMFLISDYSVWDMERFMLFTAADASMGTALKAPLYEVDPTAKSISGWIPKSDARKCLWLVH